MGIVHIEDLYHKHGIRPIQILMEDILSGTAKISIKYDGSPAVVFGHNDNGIFVATKGYFNKTPQLFYSVEDIQTTLAGRNQQLIDIMVKLFNVISYFPPEHGNIYFADVMFDGVMAATKPFQPNIVSYILKDFYRRHNTPFVMGLAVHTQLQGTAPYTCSMIWQPNVDIEEKVLPLLRGTHNASLDDVMAWKADMIKALNEIAMDRVSAFITYEATEFTSRTVVPGHEGFVIQSGPLFVKLVDKDHFTKANKDPNVKRGWTIPK